MLVPALKPNSSNVVICCMPGSDGVSSSSLTGMSGISYNVPLFFSSSVRASYSAHVIVFILPST